MRKIIPFLLIGLFCIGAKDYSCEVKKVMDGDTIGCFLETWPGDFKEISVRVVGIDTPEKEFPFGVLVKQYAIDTIPLGSKVVINNVKFDKYGRALADVNVPGIGDWKMHMIEKGYAKPYDGGSREGLWKPCELDMVECVEA